MQRGQAAQNCSFKSVQNADFGPLRPCNANEMSVDADITVKTRKTEFIAACAQLFIAWNTPTHHIINRCWRHCTDRRTKTVEPDQQYVHVNG